ncbi:MAG: hypothetical protein NVS1B5_02520 [Gemmatimonadaceae bacterium]
MSRPVASLTGPLPFRTLETVATDTFASRATSVIVTILPQGFLVDLPVERNKYVIVYIEGARDKFLAPFFGLGPFPHRYVAPNFGECKFRRSFDS